MSRAAAFFDLDRTLLLGGSGPTISAALRDEGLLPPDRLKVGRALFGLFDVVGETLPSILLTRQGVRAARGWDRARVQAVGQRIATDLAGQVERFAFEALDQHRRAGRSIVLATTTPYDLIEPFSRELGFDDVLATRYAVAADGAYSGRIDGEFVWSRGKARSVAVWSRANGVDLALSHAYSDSIFDTPLLTQVGNPVAVNPDPRLLVYARSKGWPIVWFNAPPGVPKPRGLEPQDALAQLARPELFPWMKLDIAGAEQLATSEGLLVAANHRSYLDPLIVGFVAAQAERPVRFLAKKEVTDAAVVGPITSALGAIRVDRGSGSRAPLEQAAVALRAGELIAVFPQGTIPRGAEFFESGLTGRPGAARLAIETGAPIVPLGIWGTERAWPRNSRVPYVLNLAAPPTIRVRVGSPYHPTSDDPSDVTAELMARIADLLPSESRQEREPSVDELAATYPRTS